MYYLAIETSCDETSLAILQPQENAKPQSYYEFVNSFEVLASIVSSQIEVHKEYGGVVPEIGARLHSEQIHVIFEELLERLYPKESLDDQLKKFANNVGTIFVTDKPGLKSALRVGVEFAKSLKFFLETKFKTRIKVQGVDHLHGHLSSCFWGGEHNLTSDALIFPHLHLIVSGGNSQILLLENSQKWSLVGATLDDAAGESLDKIGRMLGLPYPGGVWISRIAGLVDENPQNLPVGMKNDKLAYSFSGLKTSVRTFLENQTVDGFLIEKKLTQNELEILLEGKELNPKLRLIQRMCVSSQSVITSQLINKLRLAITKYNPKTLGISGGVSANPLLRKKVQSLGIATTLIPPLELTGDNAVMIALAGLTKNAQKNSFDNG